MIMHPTRPKLDGTSLSELKDPNGKALFVEMVAVVRRRGIVGVDARADDPAPGRDALHVGDLVDRLVLAGSSARASTPTIPRRMSGMHSSACSRASPSRRP
jgi:hypothetical protein